MLKYLDNLEIEYQLALLTWNYEKKNANLDKKLVLFLRTNFWRILFLFAF